MRLRDLYPSRFLKAEDITEEGGEIRAFIKAVKIEELQDPERGKEDKPVVYFLRIDKGLVLNKTNAETIGDAYGDETDAWAGKEVLLVTERVTAFGKTAPAIRIRIQNRPKVAPKNYGMDVDAIADQAQRDQAQPETAPEPPEVIP